MAAEQAASNPVEPADPEVHLRQDGAIMAPAASPGSARVLPSSSGVDLHCGMHDEWRGIKANIRASGNYPPLFPLIFPPLAKPAKL